MVIRVATKVETQGTIKQTTKGAPKVAINQTINNVVVEGITMILVGEVIGTVLNVDNRVTGQESAKTDQLAVVAEEGVEAVTGPITLHPVHHATCVQVIQTITPHTPAPRIPHQLVRDKD